MVTKTAPKKRAKAPFRHFEQAKIVTCYNQKGGCGKTMLSMQLGGCLGLRGYRVLIVDMDPQHTACTWSASAGDEQPFPATVTSLSMMGAKVTGEIRKSIDKYDFIILDCPPAIESEVPWAALNISDIGLIPFMPAMDNVWALVKAVELGHKAQQENPHLNLYFVPMAVERSATGAELLRQLHEKADPPGFETSLRRLNAYRDSQVLGATVHALGTKSPAARDLEALADEFLSRI